MGVALAIDLPHAAKQNLDAAPPAKPKVVPKGSLWQRNRWLWTLQSILLIALSFGLWVGGLRLFQLHNDFPFFYHPDEPSKGMQLVENDRNFNHPQLMLETALLVVPALQAPTDENGRFIGRQPDVETVVVQSRMVSAAFAAGTTVLLAWAGWAAADWIGFLAMGLGVGLCPALFSHAHFFKEDASLMFGIAVVLCAGAWALRVRGPQAKVWSLMFLGIGAGLAAAGKYCGMVMLVPAILVALPACRRQFGLLLAAPLLVISLAVLTWAVVDYRVFNEFEHFRQNYNGEETHSTTSHYGLTMDKPNQFFTSLVWQEAMPHVKVLAVLGVIVLPWQAWKRRRWGFGVWLALCVVIYLAMLSYSVIAFYRYAMPATVMLYAFAALAVAWLAALPPKWWQRGLVGVAGLALIGLTQGYRVADYNQQFANDSRDLLQDWVTANLPAGTAVAADNYTLLRDRMRYGAAPPGTPRLNLVENFAGMDAGDTSIAQLRARGVKYVITASSNNDRFASPYVHGVPGAENIVQRARDFYSGLKQYPVAWQHVAKHPMWTFANPDIVAYRIDQPPDKTPK